MTEIDFEFINYFCYLHCHTSVSISNGITFCLLKFLTCTTGTMTFARFLLIFIRSENQSVCETHCSTAESRANRLSYTAKRMQPFPDILSNA